MADDEKIREIASALRTMLQAGRQMHTALARRLDVRVTDVQAVDIVVSASEPIGPVELGNRLGIRSASATALVERLVVAEHMVREPDPRDGRRVTLAATEHARTEVRQALAPLLADLAAIAGRLDDAQADTVLTFLHETTAAIRGYATGQPATMTSGALGAPDGPDRAT